MRDGESGFFRETWRWLRRFDALQIAAVALLLTVGVVFIRSTGIQAGTAFSETIWLRQLFWIGAGAAAFLILSLCDYRKLVVPSVLFYLFSLALLVLVLAIGVRVYGAQRWIEIPGISRIQPSEFVKLAIILVLSALFSSRMFAIESEGSPRWRRRSQLFALGVAAALVAVPFLLVVRQPDLGSALILLPVGGCIVFVAGIRWRLLSVICLAVVAVVLLALLNEFCPRRVIDPETGERSIAYAGIAPRLKEYQRERLLIFLDPERDITGRGYNSHQARLAVGSGGLTGKGIGQGTQNLLGFLPYSISNNDFIFSVIAEETGFVGCLVLFAAYLVLFYTIIRTALTAADPLGRYLCVGVGVMLFSHFFINVGMCIGLAPITGLPLPFVSYGGSFILTGMSALGVVQSVYRRRAEEEA